MKTVDVYINNSDGDELHYKCSVAVTDEEKRKGLQGVEALEPDEGMLFKYDEPQKVSFWMKDTLIPLTVCFIDEDFEVIAVYDAEPGDETPMVEDGVKYVLEVNADEDIDEGDDVTIGYSIDDIPIEYDNGKMNILDKDGNVQMVLESGERIISRHETEVLIRKAKLAKRWRGRNKSKYKKYTKALGRYLFSVFERQDNRKPDTIEIKK